MTVEVVMLNGRPLSVHADQASADQAMAAHRQAHPDVWRPVGVHGWASPRTTSLHRRTYSVEQEQSA